MYMKLCIKRKQTKSKMIWNLTLNADFRKQQLLIWLLVSCYLHNYTFITIF